MQKSSHLFLFSFACLTRKLLLKFDPKFIFTWTKMHKDKKKDIFPAGVRVSLDIWSPKF